MEDLTPRRIVAHLDRFIVGQDRAKRAVAVALRNRWRRRRLPPDQAKEIHPKNLILIGPTGVGKTEIARRMAELVSAPFVKVEATKYSEVGYVGRDVDSIVRDLLDVAVDGVRAEHSTRWREQATAAAEERIAEALLGAGRAAGGEPTGGERAEVLGRLRAGALEKAEVEVRVEEKVSPQVEIFTGSGMEYMGFEPNSWSQFLSRGAPARTRAALLPVAQARALLEREEVEKRLDRDAIVREAIRRTEESGIVFLDEIDKIAGRSHDGGPDVSREGVQRDLLPLVEGTTVYTRYGTLRTDHVLFVAAGAFTIARPSDLIPELQGRFPIRVSLEPLGRGEFLRILTEPENALPKQYGALLSVEGVDLAFGRDGLEEIASLADRLNVAMGDIGARRLSTVLESLLEGILYAAPEGTPRRVLVDARFVREQGGGLLAEADLSKKL
ncbi:MAG TPA: ATP-dependent protease ATPase subunit HslU [Planctomycetota bacterium]|nr:ATP-dependent protease ATPase subunit HslU [Planctomycetota bacterium]